MDCNIVRDLIPLYIDGVCSDESADVIEEHLKECSSCREVYDEMNTSHLVYSDERAVRKPLKRVKEYKASLLLAALMLVSFAIITVGVAFESSTSYEDPANGLWALYAIIPATGFMLSLTNWFFLNNYRSKKSFSNTSAMLTLLIMIGAYVWSIFHYGTSIIGVLFIIPMLIDGNPMPLMFALPGLLFFVLVCVLSKILSKKYAELLGKE